MNNFKNSNKVSCMPQFEVLVRGLLGQFCSVWLSVIYPNRVRETGASLLASPKPSLLRHMTASPRDKYPSFTYCKSFLALFPLTRGQEDRIYVCLFKWVYWRPLMQKASIFYLYNLSPLHQLCPTVPHLLSFLPVPLPCGRRFVPLTPIPKHQGWGCTVEAMLGQEPSVGWRGEMKCITDRISCMLKNNNHRKEAITSGQWWNNI